MTEQIFTPTALTGIENDISLQLAHDAHRGTSWMPDERAAGEVRGWVELMQADYASVMKVAESDSERQSLDAAFAEYRQGLLNKKRTMLSAHSRVVSAFIAGPSNFPTRMMEKRNATYDKRMGEYIEYRDKALTRMQRMFAEPVGIRTGEAGAVDALQAKIDKAEELQRIMKDTNAAMRKHAKAGPEAQVAAMIVAGVTETQARGFLKPGIGGYGFPSFAMTNNNANIKRMKEQQAKAQKLAATETSERTIGNVRIVDNAEDDRLQMFFPVERVERPIYDLLKSHGFKWTPSIGCFQRFRGGNANYWALSIAAEYGKVTA